MHMGWAAPLGPVCQPCLNPADTKGSGPATDAKARIEAPLGKETEKEELEAAAQHGRGACFYDALEPLGSFTEEIEKRKGGGLWQERNGVASGGHCTLPLSFACFWRYGEGRRGELAF